MQGAKVISGTIETVSSFKKNLDFKDLKVNISKSQAFIWNSIWAKEVVSTYDIIFFCLVASIWRLRGLNWFEYRTKILLLEKALKEVISYDNFHFSISLEM